MRSASSTINREFSNSRSYQPTLTPRNSIISYAIDFT